MIRHLKRKACWRLYIWLDTIFLLFIYDLCDKHIEIFQVKKNVVSHCVGARPAVPFQARPEAGIVPKPHTASPCSSSHQATPIGDMDAPSPGHLRHCPLKVKTLVLCITGTIFIHNVSSFYRLLAGARDFLLYYSNYHQNLYEKLVLLTHIL